MPLGLIGLWFSLSFVLVTCALWPEAFQRLRWPLVAAVVLVLAASIALAWSGPLDPIPRWRAGLAFDPLARLVLPAVWVGASAAVLSALFTGAGRYEPGIAALSVAVATAGILSANPLLTIALLQAGALIVLAGLLVHDEGLAGHPFLNVATSLKYLTLTVLSSACLVMALLLSSFYALNPDRVEITRIVAAVFAVGFGLAAGAVPFYFHMPDVFEAAPGLATTSLAGPLQCLAFVYLIRTAANYPWLLTDEHVSSVLAGGALAGGLLAAIMAFGPRRVNRILAFNALREVSWVAFGLASASRAGWSGALVILAVRCLSEPLGILTARVAQAIAGESDLDKLGGLARLLPLAAAGSCAASFASVGLPPAASFWGLASLFAAAAGGTGAVLLVGSGLLGVWRLAQLNYAIFWRRGRAEQAAPEPWGLRVVVGGVALALLAGGLVPRLLQSPIDQLLAGVPFLR